MLLKHDCDLTNVLATRRFALLVKNHQWNRKIQRGNSRRRMLTFLELFGEVFLLIWCGNGVPTPLFLAPHPCQDALQIASILLFRVTRLITCGLTPELVSCQDGMSQRCGRRSAANKQLLKEVEFNYSHFCNRIFEPSLQWNKCLLKPYHLANRGYCFSSSV